MLRDYEFLSPEKSEHLIKKYQIDPDQASMLFRPFMSTFEQIYVKGKGTNSKNSLFTVEDLLKLVPIIPNTKFFIRSTDEGFMVGYKGRRGIYKKYEDKNLVDCLYSLLLENSPSRNQTLMSELMKHLDTSYYGNMYELNKLIWEHFPDEEEFKVLFNIINNTLLLPDPTYRLARLKESGILGLFSSEATVSASTIQGPQHYGTVWDHTIDVIRRTKPTKIQRWAAFFHDLGKIYSKNRDENGKISFIGHEKESVRIFFRYSEYFKPDEVDKISKLIYHHMTTKPWGDDCKDVKPRHIYKLQYNLRENWNDFLDLVHADNTSHSKEYCMPNQKDNIIKISENLPFSFLEYELPITDEEILEFVCLDLLQDAKTWLLKFAFSKPQVTKEELIHNIKTQWNTKETKTRM